MDHRSQYRQNISRIMLKGRCGIRFVAGLKIEIILNKQNISGLLSFADPEIILFPQIASYGVPIFLPVIHQNFPSRRDIPLGIDIDPGAHGLVDGVVNQAFPAVQPPRIVCIASQGPVIRIGIHHMVTVDIKKIAIPPLPVIGLLPGGQPAPVFDDPVAFTDLFPGKKALPTLRDSRFSDE